MKLTIKTEIKGNTTILEKIGRISTGLYNSANYHRQQIWKKTGKIPNYFNQYAEFKDNILAKLLQSQVVQQTLRELDQAYKSWYVHRKNDKTAKPPRYRKKNTPISIWWTPNTFKIIDDTHIRFSIANLGLEQKFLYIKIVPSRRYKLTKSKVKMVNVIWNNGKCYACFCVEVKEPEIKESKETMAIDLGIVNILAATDTQGHQELISGRQILSTQRYFNKKVGKLQSKTQKSTKAMRRLKQKQSRQIKHQLHIVSKEVIKQAKEKQARIIIGDLIGLKKNKSKDQDGKRQLNKNAGQKIHQWSYGTFTSLLEYKAKLSGVELLKVSERYTSRTCPHCGEIKRKNRVKRGLYKCKCGYKCNADINGAKNILINWMKENVSPKLQNFGVVVSGIDQLITKLSFSGNLVRREISTKDVIMHVLWE